MVNVIINFLKFFICKWFSTIAVEKMVIILLKELVRRTDSKVDDELFEAIFNKTSDEKGA